MASKRTCLRQLDAVKEAAADAHAAYLLRTRLRRSLLSVIRLVARREGLTEPIMPGVFDAPPDASPSAKAILEICNRTSVNSERLCQPSEALDVRWQEGWGVVVRDLDQLEHELQAA